MNKRISIYLFCEAELLDSDWVREICYGIEEEGLPYHVEGFLGLNHQELAEMASSGSQLEVGIGMDAQRHLCLHQAKLPEGYYLFEQRVDESSDLRAFGANSARLVKGMPFKL